MKQLFFFKDYLTRKYGHPLYRIPIDPGFSCPHRNSAGKGGCAFCAESGARASHLRTEMSLAKQVQQGIEFVTARYHAAPPYIAYFQAFTGTNASVDILRKTYREVLAMADFKVLIIATRPDCLPDDCLELLEELNREYEVWIELGVQSAHDETLKKINRGHDFACVEEAVRKLNDRHISCAAHLILGLPGENPTHFKETAHKISALPFQAVKVHNLLTLKGTDMAKMLAAGQVTPLNEYEYAEALTEVLRILPEKTLLMRLSAEAPDEQIIAPKWWMKKGQFLEMFRNMFETQDTNSGTKQNPFHACRTEDGSYTLYHPSYRQHFHSIAGAREESLKKYIEPCGLASLLMTGSGVDLLDVGFGLGCNACSAIRLAEETRKGFLSVTSLEFDPRVLSAALTLPESEHTEILREIRKNGVYRSDFAELHLIWGDARQSIQEIQQDFDLVFLDAFSPDSNPELWTLDFLNQLKQRMKKTAKLATYSSAYPFLGALLSNGFKVFQSVPFGRKRGGTVAALTELPDLAPLSEKDLNITLYSTAGVPYRDPQLDLSAGEILNRRKEEVAQKRSEGMPKWFKGS